MAMQGCGHNFWPVRLLPTSTAGSTLFGTNVAFDSITDRLAYVARSPISDSLTKINFFLLTVTQGCTIEVRIESVVNGRPSGTLFGANTNGTVVVADTDDATWKTVTLTASAALSAGDEFAIVVIYNSGTIPNMTFRIADYQIGYGGGKYPVLLQDTGAGTWSGLTTPLEMVVEMVTAGVISLPGLTPMSGNGTITAFNNASAPNEYAMKFVAPFKCRCVGASVMLYNQAAGSDFTVSLWPASSSANGDALAQVAEDGDYAINITDDGYVSVFFAAPVELTAGVTYYLGVRADTANNVSVGYIGVNAAITNAIRGFPIGNNTVHQAYRSWTAGTAGAWTDAATVFPMMSLIFDQLDDGLGHLNPFNGMIVAR
jgi:hypothetical protein